MSALLATTVSECDREPIHIPGAIQPHGMLLAVIGGAGVIGRASANAEAMLGFEAGRLVGQRLGEVLPPLDALLARHAGSLAGEAPARFVGKGPRGTPAESFDVVAHRRGGALILELEPPSAAGADGLLDVDVRVFVERLRETTTPAALSMLAAEEIRRLTGFDRVLVYQFDETFAGTVVAESRNDVLPSYLGLRFPASDIPAQARELYRRNRLRIIPDADATPVALLAASGEAGPLDLTFSVLRAVSPVHLDYMRNMGTQASMSLSVLRDGELWGLISCHHSVAKCLPFPVRDGCDLLTQVFALQMTALERGEDAAHRIRLGAVQARLLAAMAEEDRFIDGLIKKPGDLLALAGASGCAIVSGERCWRVGEAPPEVALRDLVSHLSEDRKDDEVFATDALGEALPLASADPALASGVLAISISKKYASYILWFRPELVRTVTWAGRPEKQIGPDERLTPRASFEAWSETVRGRSRPWQEAELGAVAGLRNAVVGIVLRRAEELASLSDELRRSNRELEAFSYSVSHDLRAPFRHIVGFSELLKQQEGASLTERGRRYVDTIIESAFAAGTLVDSLLSFSQMGRTALSPRPIDMNALVEESRRGVMRDVDPDRRIDWRIGPLGTVSGDPTMMRLAIDNLLSNAVKYSRDRAPAVISVERRDTEGEAIFRVSDNGVGFDMAYVGKLFGVFQRLHRMEEFEGTGIGLANVKRVAERHGGKVWAEGEVGRGATISMALPLDPERGGADA